MERLKFLQVCAANKGAFRRTLEHSAAQSWVRGVRADALGTLREGINSNQVEPGPPAHGKNSDLTVVVFKLFELKTRSASHELLTV
jgi:hypothetical protein